jgi:hypothetical protein
MASSWYTPTVIQPIAATATLTAEQQTAARTDGRAGQQRVSRRPPGELHLVDDEQFLAVYVWSVRSVRS